MIKLAFSAIGTGAILGLVGASYFYAYSLGEEHGKLEVEAVHQAALESARAEAEKKEAEHKQAVASIIADNQVKIEESKSEIDNLISQLSRRNRVRANCPSEAASGGVSQAGSAARPINGQEGESVEVDKGRVKEAAAECRETEVILSSLQEWARGAVELCNGGTKASK